MLTVNYWESGIARRSVCCRHGLHSSKVTSVIRELPVCTGCLRGYHYIGSDCDSSFPCTSVIRVNDFIDTNARKALTV
jgi:hypothetical protein